MHVEERFEKAFALGLYVYAMFLPFSISGAQSALMFLIITWAASMIVTGKSGYRLRIIDPVILLLLIWIAFAALFSVNPWETFPKLRKYWIFIGYFALCRACLNKEVVIRGLKIMIVSAGVVALYGIAQHIWGNAVPRYLAPEVDLFQKTGGYFHAVGLFDHHLTYGNSLLLIILTAIGMVFYIGWDNKGALYYFALVLSIFALAFSYARSAWLGFVTGIFAFGYQQGKKVLITLVLVFAVLLILATAFSPSLRFRMKRMVSISHNLERVITWKTTIEMIKDYPIFGIGKGAYRKLAPEYREGYNIHFTAKSHAHNSYLQVGVESGIFAMLLFILWLLLLVARTSYSAGKIHDKGARALMYGLLAAHLGFIVSSFFQHNLGDGEVAMTWFFLIAATFTLEEAFIADSLFKENDQPDKDSEV